MNIRDIAKKAKVSTATVSRVINHYENVTLEIRMRVQAILEECQYQPDPFAQYLGRRGGMKTRCKN